MPFRFSCPGCQHVYSVPDHAAGRSTRCKLCRTRFTVPALAPTPAPVTFTPTAMPPAKQGKENLPDPLMADLPTALDDDTSARRRIDRQRQGEPGVSLGQLLGLAGAVLLLVGVFLPAFNVPIFASISSWQIGHEVLPSPRITL